MTQYFLAAAFHYCLLTLLLFAFLISAPVYAAGSNNLFTQQQSIELAKVPQLRQNLFQLYREARYKEALPIAQELLGIAETILGAQHNNTAVSLNTVARILQKLGRLNEAKIYFKRELTVNEKIHGTSSLKAAASLNDLGVLVMTMGQLKEATPIFEAALGIRKKILGILHLDTAISFNNLGALYYKNGRYKKSKFNIEQALEIRKLKLGIHHKDTAESMNNLGLIEQAIGNLNNAKKNLEQALTINKKLLGLFHIDTITNFNNVGNLYHIMGDLRKAKSYYERAYALGQSLVGADFIKTATTLNNLGMVYKDLGNLKQAKLFIVKSLFILKKAYGIKHYNTLSNMSNYGLLLHEMGDLTTAKLYYTEVLSIRQTELGHNHPDTISSLNSLATLLRDMGDHQQAKLYYQQALLSSKKVLGKHHINTATILNNMGVLYQELGNQKKATNYYQQALSIRQKVLKPHHPDIATSFASIGNLFLDMGNTTEAMSNLKQALSIRQQELGPMHYDTATSLYDLGVAYWFNGKITKSLNNFKQANKLEENIISNTISLGGEKQKQAFMRKFSSSSDALISLHINSAPNKLNAIALALQTILQRKGRVLDASIDELQNLRKHMTPNLKNILDTRADSRAQLGYLLISPPNNQTIDNRLAQISRLNNKIKTLESQLSDANSAFKNSIVPITLKAVQQKIPAGTALIELFIYKPYNNSPHTLKSRWGKAHYVAYVLNNTGKPSWVKLGLAAPINSLAIQFRAAIATRNGQVLTLARKLDALTMAKIRPLLNGSDKLLLSPDGQLNLVPFAALIDENKKFLIEKYQISYLTSGRDLLRLHTPSNQRHQPLLLGNADYGGVVGTAAKNNRQAQRSLKFNNLEPLPGAEAEVKAIASLLAIPSKVLIGKAATEAAIKSIEGPSIVHFATHGFFLPDLPKESQSNPQSLSIIKDPLLRSGLALSGFNNRQLATSANDGVLTALEVADLDLWGTELVVLSACETALGDVEVGEGVFGLRRALVLAGAQSQMMTLWSVDDTQTKEFMISWYGQLKAGKGRAYALRQAQLAIINGDKLPATNKPLSNRGIILVQDEQPTDVRLAGNKHPNSWASFILSGATGTVKSLIN